MEINLLGSVERARGAIHNSESLGDRINFAKLTSVETSELTATVDSERIFVVRSVALDLQPEVIRIATRANRRQEQFSGEPALRPVGGEEVSGPDLDLSGLAAGAPASSVVAALLNLGLTAADIRTATGANARAIHDWKTRRAEPTRYREQLDDLRWVAEFFATRGTFVDTGIATWLRSRNAYCHDLRPLDAIAQKQFDDVRDAAYVTVGLPRPGRRLAKGSATRKKRRA